MIQLRLTPLLLVSCVPLFAQAANFGRIQGSILYKEGRVLYKEGAPSWVSSWVSSFAVTITGPSISRTQSVDSKGHFLFALLNPGDWNLEIKHGEDEKNQPTWVLVKPKKLKTVKVEAGKTSSIEIEVRGFATADPLVNYPGPMFDITQPGTGLKLESRDWEHLPIQ